MKAYFVLISLLFFLLSTGTIYGNSESAAGTKVNAAGSEFTENEDSAFNPKEQASKLVKQSSKLAKKFVEEAETAGTRRVDRPFQLQLHLSGGTSSHGEFGPGVGLHIGYQFSKMFYLGLSSQTVYSRRAFISDNSDRRYDDSHHRRKTFFNGYSGTGYEDESYLGQKGAKKIETSSSPQHLVEMRFYPWDFGLYFSGGIMYQGKEKTKIEYRKRSRDIGENEYQTGLEATLAYDEWIGPAAGIGFNHIFASGFSLGAGFGFGMGLQKPEVTVNSTEPVATADLEDWKEQIEANERRIPVECSFAIGYAF